MKRREFISLLGCGLATGLPRGVRAQSSKIYRVGLAFTTTPLSEMAGPDPIVPSARAFVHGLRDLGYVEGSITGKWLAMLKEIAPHLARVGLLVSPSTAYDYFVQAATAAAVALPMEIVPSRVENAADIERAIESFARMPNGGLLLPPDSITVTHRVLVIMLAARHRLPARFTGSVFSSRMAASCPTG